LIQRDALVGPVRFSAVGRGAVQALVKIRRIEIIFARNADQRK
jgi:hypothetical protein